MVISTLVDTFRQENKFPVILVSNLFFFGHVYLAPGKPSIQYYPGNALGDIS